MDFFDPKVESYQARFFVFWEGSSLSAAASLLEVFSQLEDPRKPRGVRHPFAGIVALTVLGMLARIRRMEVLVRWATVHWDALREPLGFDREQPPCATTTISRTPAKSDTESKLDPSRQTFNSSRRKTNVKATTNREIPLSIVKLSKTATLLSVYI